MDRTSDGRGVISTLELADLHELDFASWKSRQRDPLLEASWEQADIDRERGRVLTFERLLELVLDARTPEGSRVQLQVETKHPTRYGPLVEQNLVDVLSRFGLATPLSRSVSQIAVLSYAPTSRGGRVALPTVKAHPGYVQKVQAHGHRCTCSPPTRRPTSTCWSSSAWTRSSATTPAGSCAASAASKVVRAWLHPGSPARDPRPSRDSWRTPWLPPPSPSPRPRRPAPSSSPTSCPAHGCATLRWCWARRC